MTASLAVFTSHSELITKSTALAKKLQLPFTQSTQDYSHILIVTPDYLGIQKVADPAHPFYIDFTAGKISYRRQQLSLRREALARAMGLKTNIHPKIVDATAGLARDSFIIAALGFDIQLVERSPIIAALLEDGMQRALANTECAPIIKRMQLIQADAISWLNNMSERPDIIYLDPMFPERRKSALAKKDMQIFQSLVGADIDSDQLLKTALTCANQRVVVKRPRLASELAGLKPSFFLTGSSSRFDVYLT